MASPIRSPGGPGEPLGQRTVVDANFVPARALQVGTEERSFDPQTENRDAVERALFDPSPELDDDEIAYRFQADVDSPGDSIHGG